MHCPRKHEQKASLNAGSSLSDEEADLLDLSSSKGDCSVIDRFKLIGYCLRDESSIPAKRDILFRQLRWLMINLPELELYSTVSSGLMCLDSDQMFRMYKDLLDILKEKPHSKPLLLNAVIFLQTCKRDDELLRRLSNELNERKA